MRKTTLLLIFALIFLSESQAFNTTNQSLFLPLNGTNGVQLVNEGWAGGNWSCNHGATYINDTGKYRLELNGSVNNDYCSPASTAEFYFYGDQCVFASAVVKATVINSSHNNVVLGMQDSSTTRLKFGIGMDAKNAGAVIGSIFGPGNTTLYENTWYHIAMRWNYTNERVYYWVNGMPAGSIGANQHLNGTILTFHLGAYGGQQNFKGLVSNVRLINGYCPTDAEVVEINNTDFTEGSNVAPGQAVLNSPANNTVYNDTFTVTFNYTSVDVNDYVVCSLKINDVVNVTNTSNLNNTSFSNSVGLPLVTGNYNWSVNCSDGEYSSQSLYYYFTVGQSSPAQITGLGYSADTANVYLTWSANSETDLAQYSIFKSTDAVNYAFLTNTTGLAATDSGLASGTNYYYKVSANDTAGNYGDNASITATTVSTGGGGSTAGGGGGGSGIVNITACGLFIKFPESRTMFFRFGEENASKTASFIICNENDVTVSHSFNLLGDLTSHCTLKESSKEIIGNSCYTGEVTCAPVTSVISDRLVIKRSAYDGVSQKIEQCESNIIVEVGQYSLIDGIWKQLSFFGSTLILDIVVIVLIMVSLVALVISSRR